MGEGTALHGGAGHCGCHQSRPQPLPEVCSGVHAEGPRLPARSALRKLLRDTLKHSMAALLSAPGLPPSMTQLRGTDCGCLLLTASSFETPLTGALLLLAVPRRTLKHFQWMIC